MPPVEMDLVACLESGELLWPDPTSRGVGKNQSIYEFLIDGLQNNSYR